MDPRLLSSTHAAQYLGVSRPQLYTLPVRFVMIGRKRRYDVRDLDAYVEQLHAERDNRRPAA